MEILDKNAELRLLSPLHSNPLEAWEVQSISVFCIKSYFCLTFQEVVSQNCVVIFSKTTCPYCKMAKNVFNEIGASYKVVELDEHNDGRRLQEALAQMTGARTVRASCCILGSESKVTLQPVILASILKKDLKNIHI